jgi:hypothetical protein
MLKLKNSLVLLLAFFVLSACAPCVDCGRIVLNHNVTNVFDTATINPNYRYYYSGNDAEPDAIMGLQKEYSLTGGYWTEVELTKERLAWWIESIDTSQSLYVDKPNGFEIRHPEGGVVGHYYSRLEWLVVKFPEPGVIYVSTPDALPWKGEENDDEHSMGDYLRF